MTIKSSYVSNNHQEKSSIEINVAHNLNRHLTSRKSASRLLLKDIGVPKGAVLIYVGDPSIQCTVVDTTKNIVEYKGKEFTLSGLIRYLKGNNHTYRGSLYLMYNGKRLTDIREETVH